MHYDWQLTFLRRVLFLLRGFSLLLYLLCLFADLTVYLINECKLLIVATHKLLDLFIRIYFLRLLQLFLYVSLHNLNNLLHFLKTLLHFLFHFSRDNWSLYFNLFFTFHLPINILLADRLINLRFLLFLP